MKYTAQFFLLLFSTFAQANELTMLTDLSSLQWKNRIIVVNNVQNEEKVLALFEKNSAEINDRDIVWFMIKGDRIVSNYSAELGEELLSNIRERYRVSNGQTVLIGKDGGIKSRLERVDLESLFSEIDAMPMRQREMQN